MGGPSGTVSNTQEQLTQEQIKLAQQQQDLSNQTFSVVSPGLKTAENYYASLASGDPTKLATAEAPAINAIATSTEQAKKAILANTPRGGAQDLALQEADISKAGQIGNLETQAYTSAFPALASLFSGGAGISVNQIANAIAGYQGASSTIGQLGQEQAQGKATTMGFFGSLAGAAGTAAA